MSGENERLTTEEQEKAILAQKINPAFVSVSEVSLGEFGDASLFLQYDGRGSSQYILKGDDGDEVLKGGVVVNWNFVNRGDEDEPRRGIVLFNKDGEFEGSLSYDPIKWAKIHLRVDSKAELERTISESATSSEQALLDDPNLPKDLVLAQIANQRFEDARQKSIIKLEGDLKSNEGKIAQNEAKIAQGKARIATIKARMSGISSEIEEKQRIVDEYNKNKPWFARVIDFVTENFGACMGMLVGSLGMMKCDNNALWTLSAGVAVVSGLIAMKVIDVDSVMEQASNALGYKNTDAQTSPSVPDATTQFSL